MADAGFEPRVPRLRIGNPKPLDESVIYFQTPSIGATFHCPPPKYLYCNYCPKGGFAYLFFLFILHNNYNKIFYKNQ